MVSLDKTSSMEPFFSANDLNFNHEYHWSFTVSFGNPRWLRLLNIMLFTLLSEEYRYWMIVFLLSLNSQGPVLSLGVFSQSDCTFTISICWLLFLMCLLSSSRVSIFGRFCVLVAESSQCLAAESEDGVLTSFDVGISKGSECCWQGSIFFYKIHFHSPAKSWFYYVYFHIFIYEKGANLVFYGNREISRNIGPLDTPSIFRFFHMLFLDQGTVAFL